MNSTYCVICRTGDPCVHVFSSLSSRYKQEAVFAQRRATANALLAMVLFVLLGVAVIVACVYRSEKNILIQSRNRIEAACYPGSVL